MTDAINATNDRGRSIDALQTPTPTHTHGTSGNTTVPNPAQVARQLKRDAEELKAAVEVIPRPFTSYAIIGNLAAANQALTESLEELCLWHAQAKDGTHYQDVDGLGVQGTQRAAARLEEAAQLAKQLKNVLQKALDESGKVRWLDAPDAGPGIKAPTDEELAAGHNHGNA